jgi:RNase H-fold protein (predicted Holliday junction resolvase)
MIICFDYGFKYIGAALGCYKTKIVKALPYIHAQSFNVNIQLIKLILKKHNATTLLIGISHRKNCPILYKVIKALAERLRTSVQYIYFIDEDNTTKIAEIHYIKHKKGIKLHSTAACLLLNSWLIEMKHKNPLQ